MYNPNQFEAYRAGVTNIDDALKFTNMFQVLAYSEENAPVDIALQINNNDDYVCYIQHKDDVSICGLHSDLAMHHTEM